MRRRRRLAELESRVEGLETLLADLIQRDNQVHAKPHHPSGPFGPEAVRRYNEAQERQR